MSGIHTTLILIVALIAVFLQVTCTSARELFGAQPNPLPALMVYTALHANIGSMAMLAILGSLWQSALSADPPGIAMLPLFLIGTAVELNRQYIARQKWFARFIIGTAASALLPLTVLFILLSLGHQPLLSWLSLWQLFITAIGGGLITLAVFPIMAKLREWLVEPEKANGYRFEDDLAESEEW